MLDPIHYQLNPTEMEYFEELKKVFLIMSEELEEKRVRKKLRNIIPEKEHHFSKLMNDVELIFGRVRKISKDFQKSLQRERLKGYIHKLKKDEPKDFMLAIAKFEEMLMKLDNLHMEDSVEEFDWSTLQIPQITYSSASAFLSDGSEDIEIIDDGEI
jgi:hypothetical protein